MLESLPRSSLLLYIRQKVRRSLPPLLRAEFGCSGLTVEAEEAGTPAEEAD